ncbi:MAG TPA: hypothetical protein VLF20_00180, partial [Patescibacteria group bacterium]|nr:hypothetical protein [Patescibacteria group bacterium]
MPTIFTHTEKKKPEEKHEEIQTPANPSLSHAMEAADKLTHTRPKNIGLFAAFAKQPKGVIFVNQEPDEAILLFLRRHFITNIPWIIASLILCAIPPVILSFLSFLSFRLPEGLSIVLLGLYYLIVMSY